MPDITIDDLRAARMRMTLSLDGDNYCNTFQCNEYPELTRVDTGPNKYRQPNVDMGHTKQYFVAGELVERSYEAIVAALNAHRAASADDEVNGEDNG